MKKILLPLFIVWMCVSTIYAQSWTISNRITSTSDISEISSTIDDVGNTYVFGYFNDTISSSSTEEAVSHGMRDYFIAKFLQNGNIDWMNALGGPFNDFVLGGIGVDQNRDVFITGAFFSHLKYSETDSLVSTGLYDVFFIKYSENGDVLWARNAGTGARLQSPTNLDVDFENNILIAGYFVDSINIYNDTTLYADIGDTECFYAKYDGSNGDLIWSKEVNSLNTLYGLKIYDMCPSSTSIGIGGIFIDSVAFENDTISTETSFLDAHVGKIDLDGNLEWIRRIGGNDSEYSYSITTDDDGNIYIGGYTDGDTIRVDINESDFQEVEVSYGGLDLFIAKYSSTGDLIWIRTAGGKDDDKTFDIEYFDDMIHISGVFADTMHWGGIELSTNGINDKDMFIASIDLDGNFRSANSYSGRGNSTEQARAIFKNADNLFTVIRTDSDLLVLGDSIYTSPGGNFFIAVGVIGCLPISIDKTVYSDIETCYGDTTGSILIAAAGGFGGPWTYSIDNNASSSSSAFFEDLPAGDYQVVVIDAEGCTEIGPLVSLTQPDLLEAVLNSSANIVIRDPRWPNDDGFIQVAALGGSEPYTYWLMPDGAHQNNGTFLLDSDDYIDAIAGDTLYYVVAIDDNQNCGPALSDTISIELILGFETKTGLEINVYPNPTSGLVNIEFPYAESECDLEVLNMTGQMVARRKVYSSGGIITETIDLSDQAKGLYMIRIDGQALQSAVMVK